MKPIRFLLLMSLVVLVGFIACTPEAEEPDIKLPDTENPENPNKPDNPNKPEEDNDSNVPLVNVATIQFKADKDAQLIQINSSENWSITTSDSWIECTAYTGKGTTAILVGVIENNGFQRQGSISVVSDKKQQEIIISQNSASKITTSIGGVDFTIVLVEGDKFNRSEYGSYYSHEVELDDFFIAETEVTNALWKAVTGGLPYDTLANDIKDNPLYVGLQLPVSHVSYYDITTVFLPLLKQKLNKNFHLPTEAQWEWAARGGKKSKGYQYAGSDNLDEVAWTYSNSQHKKNPVKKLEPNELGLYDMSGNVIEWCADWRGDYPRDYVKNPTGPTQGQFRVMRGGNYTSSSSFSVNAECLVNYRNSLVPSCYEVAFPGTEYERVSYQCETVGFRMALSGN